MNTMAYKIFIIAIISNAIFGSTRIMESGDPNRTATWAWTEKTKYEIFAAGGDDRIQRYEAMLPFYTAGNIQNLIEEQDMNPSDGWVLVHRDFGTPTAAQHFPFFTLYNKYRGIFRVMLFNANNREGTCFWGELRFANGHNNYNKSAGIFSFADKNENRCSLDTYNPDIALTATSNMTAYASWAVFDFPIVGYDPSRSSKDPVVTLRVTSIDKEDLSLKTTGDFEIYNQILANGGTARPGYSAGIIEICNSIQSGVGIANSAYVAYKTIDAFLDNEIRSQTAQEKHKGEAWFSTLLNLANTKTAGAIPYLSAMTTVIQAFIGGANRGSQWVPFYFKGQMHLSTTGTLLKSHELWCHNFFLNAGPFDDAVAQRPVNNVDWGVFNFKELPTVRSSFDADTNLVTTKLEKGADNLIINPNSGMQLVSTRVAFFRPEDEQGNPAASAFMTLEEASRTGFSHPKSGILGQVTELIWELKFKVQSPTRFSDDEILVIKRTKCIHSDFLDQMKFWQDIGNSQGIQNVQQGLSEENLKKFQEAFPNAVPFEIHI